MPELPEVETVRNTLKKLVLKKTIIDVDSHWDGIIANVSLDEFKSSIENQRINDIERYGKFLVFILDTHVIVSHLRMEGKYFYKNNSDKLAKHDHIIFKFSDATELRYNDTRKFGKMHLMLNDNYLKVAPLANLGYEPWVIDLAFLKSKFQKTSRPIKVNLLDQKYLVGLGNIYVDEVLFLSNIHPMTKTNSLAEQELEKIITNSKIVLDKAIALGGTTIRSYTSSEGVSGRFQNELLVHAKKGEPCPSCSNKIMKIKVGGRGTYICEICQKIL